MTRPSSIPDVRRTVVGDTVSIVIDAETLFLRPSNETEDPLIVINGRHLLDELLRDLLEVASDQPVRIGGARLTLQFDHSQRRR